MAKFVSKKVALILLTVIVAASGIIWAVVANIQSKFNSGITDIPEGLVVSGNGTGSVLVDDYLYFVGDSVSTKDIAYGDNEYFADGKVMDTGIYRLKIKDGQPNLTYEYDNTIINEQGDKVKLQPDDEGYNTKVVAVKDWENIGKEGTQIEAVVPKIAGHDQTAMWVFGDYLIYTSPHNRRNNRGKLLSNYLDFFRVNLDGSNHTLIYTTEDADLTTANFNVWANSTNNIYLLVHEKTSSTIKRINVADKTVTTLDEKVGNVIFPQANYYSRNNENETLDKIYGGVMSYVYYTKEREDGLKGNLLYRRSIVKADSEPKIIASEGGIDNGTTFKPLAVTPLENGNAQFVFSLITTDIDKPILCLIDNHNYLDYDYKKPSDTWGLDANANNDGNIKVYANGFVVVNKTLHHYTINGADMIYNKNDLYTNVDKVLAVYGDTAYVQSGTTVARVKISGSSVNITVVPEKPATDESESTDTEEPAHTITLPVAVLYQPQGATGDPMIFVQDADHIRLYTQNSEFNYLKFKQV